MSSAGDSAPSTKRGTKTSWSASATIARIIAIWKRVRCEIVIVSSVTAVRWVPACFIPPILLRRGASLRYQITLPAPPLELDPCLIPTFSCTGVSVNRNMFLVGLLQEPMGATTRSHQHRLASHTQAAPHSPSPSFNGRVPGSPAKQRRYSAAQLMRRIVMVPSSPCRRSVIGNTECMVRRRVASEK
jgi:hypothetical protein